MRPADPNGRTPAEFSSDIVVKLVHADAKDDYVVQAAQVSAKGENNPNTVPERLIEALMYGKHGSPFEHNSFTFFVKAPIFVFREWMRHRISSFNEMSGRYTVLPGEFYVPDENRMVVNAGTKMKPDFVWDGVNLNGAVRSALEYTSVEAWDIYNDLLDREVAPEVARMALPLNTYSQMYWTVNARSLMNFLSLRGDQTGARVTSYPQLEIQMGAMKVEEVFAELMPLTHAAFVKGGLVAP